MAMVYKVLVWLAVALFLGTLSWQVGAFFGARKHAPRNAATGDSDRVTVANSDSLTNEIVAEPAKPRFIKAENCALCHSNSDRATAMRDAKDRSIAPFDLWQTSMMANSARDPFWRAVLSAEVAATPSMKATIEEKCTRCHAPMAAPAPESPRGDVLTYLKRGNKRSELGLDGVSCTVCHQITDRGLGTEESFTGHFEINSEARIFGPHANPFPRPMQMNVGYTPTHGSHILKSGLCATCHTLNTTSVDSAGAPTAGEFHEQSPYLEWRNSVFNDEVSSPDGRARSCQSCHMPTVDADGNEIETRLAHNPGGRDFPFLKPRSPFGRHSFPSANTLMKQILRDNAVSLGVAAPVAAFDQSIDESRNFLATKTAAIELETVSWGSGMLQVKATVRNLAGHKLPTAYPSRRVWIELTVTNEAGQSIFASGRFNEQGELIDGDGDVLASETAGGPVNVHRTVVDDPDQVQVYETIMADAAGQPTFTLLRGASFVKDNRLLPEGWRAEHDDGPATRPYGTTGDDDFVGGSDTLVYKIPVPDDGPHSVQATLWFQVISPRHANELFEVQTAEVVTFRKMFEAADRKPEELASAKILVVDD